MASARSPRRVLALWIFLALTTLTVVTAAAALSPTAHGINSSNVDANSTTTDDSTNRTVSVSACALCRDRGQCDQAYQGGAGVFCAAHVPTPHECCCATSTTCPRVHSSSTSGDCACLAPPERLPRPPAQPRIGIFSSHTIVWTLLTMAALGALFAMYMYTTRLDRKYHYREPTGAHDYRPPARIPVPVVVASVPAIEGSTDSKSSVHS